MNLPHGRHTIPPTTTDNYLTTTTNEERRCATANWSTIASRAHPNRQHVNFSKGTGPSSSKRYRRRTTKRNTTTSSTTSNLQQTIAFQHRTNKTLRRIHNKHQNVLTSSTDTAHTDIDLEEQINTIISEINTISNTFDETYQRIIATLDEDNDNDEEHNKRNTTTTFLNQLFNDADATLSIAISKLLEESDSITHRTEQTILDLRKLHSSDIILPTTHPSYHYDDDDKSIDTDECADLTELYELYKDHTNKCKKHDNASSSTDNTNNLNQLLQLYLPKPWRNEPTPPPPHQQPTHYYNTILPPHPHQTCQDQEMEQTPL
jgi:hypothetical protein